MWIMGKVDQSSQKEQIFTELCCACRVGAPMAQLSLMLRNKIERLSREERKEIVSRKRDGCAPLFVACKKGNVEIVEYLITTCNAPVEQKGLYQVPDDRTIHLVTPLWCAAVAGKYEVVKCLVQHEADVNSESDTGSTPVRSACFMNHLQIVVYLIQNGANISKPNYNGGTCLINSVQNVKLCDILLKYGVDVNAQDIQNKTALHYAIQEHRFETTKLLIKRGANPHLMSRYNDDALQTACIKGDFNIFSYLIENVKYSYERIADGYELLGSTYLDEHHDIYMALDYWKKGHLLRIEHNIPKKILPPRKMYKYATEFNTLEELDIITHDHNMIRTQSLLICERILGTSHRDMIFRLMYRGAAYADSLQYTDCINLWLYTFQLRVQRDTILFSDTSFTARAIVRLYLDNIEKYENGIMDYTVDFDDAYYTLELIAQQIPECVKFLKIRPIHKQHQQNFDNMLQVFSHLIYIIFKIDCSKEQMYRVAVLVNSIIKLDPRTCYDGFSLLHLAVTKANVLLDNLTMVEKIVNPFPSVKVLEFLLMCGAPINRCSDAGWSPLYVASLPNNYRPEIVEALLKAGAHIDQATEDGESAVTYLSLNPNCEISVLNHISLKCLSARVIKEYKIPYRNEVPRQLESFIEMH